MHWMHFWPVALLAALDSRRDVQVRLPKTEDDTMEKRAANWIMRWKYQIASEPSKPGVWRRKEGGYLIRGRGVDCRTGKLREIMRVVEGTDAGGAYRLLQQELEKIRSGTVQAARERIRFSEYAASLFERKVAKREINSAKTREKWETILRLHLIPAFGDYFVDGIRRTDIEEWLTKVGRAVNAGKYSPVTVNNWLSILRVVINSAADDFDWERNPITNVDDIDTSTHVTYTEEEPNALLPDEVRRFLGCMLEMFPQHFAMVAVGFATGLRPSSLRPIRRKGSTPDVLWDQRMLLIRRSQTRGAEVMEATKQKTRYRITMPTDLVDILRWHVDQLPEGRMRTSDLLFPSDTGGFRAPSALDKPFLAVVNELGLRKTITPKAMRRTFQDLARSADIEQIVRQKICGHATDEMTDLYSTIPQPEIERAVGKIISIAGYRHLPRDGASWWESGGKEPRNENGQSAAAS
jgi:integrase